MMIYKINYTKKQKKYRVETSTHFLKKYRLGNNVIVIAGDSKNKVGKIIKILENNYVYIDTIYKSRAARKKEEVTENKVKMYSKIHVSNIAHFNSESNKKDKAIFVIDNDKKKCAYKSNNKIIT